MSEMNIFMEQACVILIGSSQQPQSYMYVYMYMIYS